MMIQNALKQFKINLMMPYLQLNLMAINITMETKLRTH